MDLTHNIIEYVNCCVGAFAIRFKLSLTQSYAYLRRFKGIAFLLIAMRLRILGVAFI